MRQKQDAMIGTKVPDINLLNTMGENVLLSQYLEKSEYIYLNFWASWCGPCIGKFPYLKAAREKHSENKLKIIGISLDDSKENWLGTIKEHNIETAWTQLIVPKDSINKVWEMFFIRGIPYGILLNRKGEIVRVRMWITEIDDFFENY
jgi:thiol-disulfide isomerase/thioredoxin